MDLNKILPNIDDEVMAIPLTELEARHGRHIKIDLNASLRASYLRVLERLARSGSDLDKLHSEASIESLPATKERIAVHFGLTTLDALTTSHMQVQQAARFEKLLERVREWRTADYSPKAFVLSSKQVGIGKTHIATAVADSFSLKWIEYGNEPAFLGGKPNFHLLSRGRILTARALMQQMDEDGYSHGRLFPAQLDCLVLDDVGREGDVKYTKRSIEAQQAEKQTRYFELINYVYTARRESALFITTNLALSQLQAHIGEAAWSRLTEMCAGRYAIGIEATFPDYREVKARTLLRQHTGE